MTDENFKKNDRDTKLEDSDPKSEENTSKTESDLKSEENIGGVEIDPKSDENGSQIESHSNPSGIENLIASSDQNLGEKVSRSDPEQSEKSLLQTKEVQANEPQNSMKNRSSHIEPVYYAGFWMRFWAYLLDLVVAGSLNRLLVYPIAIYFDLSMVSSHPFSFFAISTTILSYLYFVLMTKYLGQTLGKMVFGLKVYDQDFRTLTWSTVIFREFIGRFISKTVFMLGYLTVAFTKRKKGWHDMIADTIVVLERRR
jgi:uncharacterized RDD family membrane protein YckC